MKPLHCNVSNHVHSTANARDHRALGFSRARTVLRTWRSGSAASSTFSTKGGANATTVTVTTAITTTTRDEPTASPGDLASTSLPPPTFQSTAAPLAPSTTTTPSTATTTFSTDPPPTWRWEESHDAVVSYGALVALLALGNLPVLHTAQLADLPYFVGLAVTTLYIGAHRGLTSRQRQQISLKEGVLAPVLASASLFGCYLLIKYLPQINIKVLLDGYFWLLGSVAIGGAAVPVLRRVAGPLGEMRLRFPVREGLLLDEQGKSITQAQLAPTDVLAVALALGLSSAELASGHSSFTLNNLVATLIATDILQLIGPRSFRTAGLLLAGLLLYDVFWVFGSPKVVGDNVMLTVATSDLISGPTRILFPRVPGGGGSTLEAAAAAFPFSLLGLGDIAIPGLLACLALRYDASRATDSQRTGAATQAEAEAEAEAEPASSAPAATQQQQQQPQQQQQQRLPVSEAVLQHRTYFTAVMVAYVVGLVAAFVANDVTGLGQPALLYIVPATLGAVVLVGAQRGELGRLWGFTDVPSYGVGVAKKEGDGKGQ